MALVAIGLVSGLIFGWGLQISGMTDPNKVLNFLDPFGAWDPSLAVVMAVALAVAAAGFAIARRRAAPQAATALTPSERTLDGRLIGGAMLFGGGWGLVGLCPGPAVESLATLSPRAIVFVAAMIAGMALHHAWTQRRPADRGTLRPASAEADG